jgi:putative transposase
MGYHEQSCTLIISAKHPEKANLSDIIIDLKKYTSSKIIAAIETENERRKEWMLDKFRFAASKNKRNANYQFWIHNHAAALISYKFQTQSRGLGVKKISSGGPNIILPEKNHAKGQPGVFATKCQHAGHDSIHENPVKEGWVALPEHYCYSSAIDYSDKKGMIDITFL